MLAVRRGGVDSVKQLVASMFLMETQVMMTMDTGQRQAVGLNVLDKII